MHYISFVTDNPDKIDIEVEGVARDSISILEGFLSRMKYIMHELSDLIHDDIGIVNIILNSKSSSYAPNVIICHPISRYFLFS